MSKKLFILLLFPLLVSGQINKKKAAFYMLSQPSTITYPIWEGGGSVPPSTNYSIYNAMGAADLASSYINLANPGTRNITAGVAPTFTAGLGWTFNGSSQYLNTNTYQNGDWTTIIWVEGSYSAGATAYVMGSVDTYLYGISRVNQSAIRFDKNNNSIPAGTSSTNSIIAMSGTKGWRNNQVVTSSLGTFATTSTRPSYVGAVNNAGTATNLYAGSVRMIFMYNFVLSDDQIKAVCRAMYSQSASPNNSYSTRVLATTPISYISCNGFGSVMPDLTSSNAWSEGYLLPLANYGVSDGSPYGKSISFSGTTYNMRGSTNWGTATNLNMNEFSAAAWIKVNVDGSKQIRVFNLFTTIGGYVSMEIRSGNRVALYFLENGVAKNTEAALTVTVTDGQWHHIAFTNSLTAGKACIYLDGTKYEYTRDVLLTGFAAHYVVGAYPQSGQELQGSMNHIAYWDRVLTQSEINSLQ